MKAKKQKSGMPNIGIPLAQFYSTISIPAGTKETENREGSTNSAPKGGKGEIESELDQSLYSKDYFYYSY